MALTRSITPKNISAKKPSPKDVQPLAEERVKVVRDVSDKETPEGERKEVVRAKKACFWCKNNTEPAYWDVAALRRYLSDRGRIITRSRSGACGKHQRRVAQEIKRARHLSLLSFTSKTY